MRVSHERRPSSTGFASNAGTKLEHDAPRNRQMKIVGHRHPGIPPAVWARFLTDRQLRREIRQVLSSSLNLDRSSNEALDLLLREASERPSMQDWLARCLELLAGANAFTLAEHPTKANSLTFVPRCDRAAS